MKNTIKFATLFVLSTFTYSCSNENTSDAAETASDSYTELKKADWLLGVWQNNSPEGILTESWKMENDSVYAGNSYFVIGKDTVSSESISLEQQGKALYYIPIVKDQNDGKPVSFKLTAADTKRLVFENPKHDFPQKITYTLVNSDSLVAEISGTIDGKQNAQQFAMSRAK